MAWVIDRPEKVLVKHIKPHDSVSCGQVQPVQAHDRQVCIVQEPRKCCFHTSVMPERNCTIFVVESPSG